METLVVSDHVCLEALKLSMAQDVFSAIDKNRDFLRTWLPFVDFTLELSDTVLFIQSITAQKESRKKDEIFGIFVDGEFGGLIGFKDTDWINRKTEIGYWLIKEMQGKGIITSCVGKLISYSFQKLKLNRIQIKVAVGNTKSAAIPRRLGFQFEGIERAGERHNNKFFDLEVFSLLRSDNKV
ncbi:GNAT family N-acetyltransferase [Maribellus comscasis]|uniref:GNAT family N-acetyltransferase n=1 Tax=Maribellus comscasis TaxID=2681766 RepID=A0A6I6JWK9_9BACT|nr:GNAT family protein [Maribellus comscasis]QGY44497.1 GNAT family N-acetyltransferase [Maribellus comscasis]